jgi:hypothetical protein
MFNISGCGDPETGETTWLDFRRAAGGGCEADWVEICKGGPLMFLAAREGETPVTCENWVAGGFDGDSVVGGEG